MSPLSAFSPAQGSDMQMSTLICIEPLSSRSALPPACPFPPCLWAGVALREGCFIRFVHSRISTPLACT